MAPKAVSDWMECERSPDISRVDVFPCLSDYAGTDSAVRLALQSERELCFTNVLDNNGNDLARGWKNSYRQVNAECYINTVGSPSESHWYASSASFYPFQLTFRTSSVTALGCASPTTPSVCP